MFFLRSSRVPAVLAMAVALTACGSNTFLAPPPLVADPILIDAKWVPSTPTAEQLATIEVTIQNQGGFDAKAFKCRVFVQGPAPGNYEIEFEQGLQAGDAVVGTVQHDFNNFPGNYCIALILDEDERIDENIDPDYDGETNNVYNCRNTIFDNQGRATLTPGETSVVVLGQGGPPGFIPGRKSNN